MANANEMRQLLNLDSGPAKDQMLEELTEREGHEAIKTHCSWCGGPIQNRRRGKVFCKDQCRYEFHNTSKRILRLRAEAGAQLDQI